MNGDSKRESRVRSYRALVLACVVLTFIVVVVGAYVRLSDAGLGCPDWPGCYGQITPASAESQIRSAVQAQGGTHGPVSMPKAWKEMGHRYLAGVLGLLILAVAILAWMRRGALRQSPWLAGTIVIVVVIQATLGKRGAWMFVGSAIAEGADPGRSDIYVGRALMKDLNHYAVHHRGLRASLGRNPQPALFLNQSGAPFSADGKSLDRIVRLIGERAGVRTWTHLLRHTYATWTLAALQRARDRNRIEPVVFVQRQLGHASIQTTMVYLHLVQDLADDAVLTYDDELDEFATATHGQAQDLHQE